MGGADAARRAIPAASPFLTAAHEHAADEPVAAAVEPVHEDVSDGLSLGAIRKCHSWLTPTYTRRDCTCGFCSIGDLEPCPYAKPELESPGSVVGTVLSAGARSLSRLLSVSNTTHASAASSPTKEK